jgi:hypothetical protein
VKSITLRIVAGALGLRALTAFAAFLINAVFPMGQREQFTVFPSTNLFWDTFARFDSGWYFNIARYGYEWVEGGRSNLAFFPLYPMLMRYVALGLGGGRSRVYMAGILISWTTFIAAMIVLHRLARVELEDEEAALRTVLYVAVFPFAFFFGVVYTESLFLLLSVTAFYGFRTQRWALGAVAGALVTATRANGLFLVPALALVAWRETRGDRAATLRASLALVCTLTGVALYSAWVYSVTGHPFEWANTINRWNWHPGATAGWTPLLTVITALFTRPYEYVTSSPQAVVDLLNAGAGLALLLATPFIWLRFGPAYPVLILLNLYVPLSSGALEGIGRYCAVLFPFSLWLATWRAPILRAGLIVASAMFYVLCLALFTKVYPLF